MERAPKAGGPAAPGEARAGAARPGPGAFERALRLVVLVVPFTVALLRAASAGQWQDDAALLRDLGLVVAGPGGGLSLALAQLWSLLPIGSNVFRLALGSAVALAVAARLVFALAGSLARALEGRSPTSRPSPLALLVAAMAALTASLAPTWQREGTLGGGAVLAMAGSLAVLLFAVRVVEEGSERGAGLGRLGAARPMIAMGALAGATFAESAWAAVPGILAGFVFLLGSGRSVPLTVAFGPPSRPGLRGLVRGLVHGEVVRVRVEPVRAAIELPPPRVVALTVLAFALVAAFLLAPSVLRPLAADGSLDAARFAPQLAAEVAPSSVRVSALAAWSKDVGLVSVGVAAFGFVTVLYRRRERPLGFALLVLVAVDALFPAAAPSSFRTDPRAALRLLSVAAIGIGSAAGLMAAIVVLLRSGVALARSAAALLVLFHVTLVALTSEEAGYAADRSDRFGAEAWTDHALGGLDPFAVVLVRSPSLADRLWTAQIARGERPDVLVVPMPLLGRGAVAGNLVRRERAVEPLLRDAALTGAPTEFSLSTLADARPLFVELDARWDARLRSHLAGSGPWLAYAPQPLGPSDRRAYGVRQLPGLRRVLAALGTGPVPDAATAAVVAGGLHAQAFLLAGLGDRETADWFFGEVSAMGAKTPSNDAALAAAVTRLVALGVGLERSPSPGAPDAPRSPPAKAAPARARSEPPPARAR